MRQLATAGAIAAACLAATSVQGQAPREIRIGVVTTLTTPAAIIGREIQDALNLAVEHAGGEAAGLKLRLIVEDDGLKPDIGRQKTEKLVRQDNVDIVTGYVWSNVLLASRKSVLDAGKILISTNAAPSDMAGRLCNPAFFAMRGQGDVMAMALGADLDRRGVRTAYTMAPNYAAGKDVIAGFQRTFSGKLVGQDFTKWGDDPQLDFSAELTKVAASGAEALVAFYPGRAAAFMKQFEQSGLAGKVKLYTVYTLDQTALPSLQQGNVTGALGTSLIDYWYPDLDTPENKRFVADFRARYGRTPSNYAAAAYDVIPFVKAALETVKGDLSDKAALQKALAEAKFRSVRGAFRFGRNQMPLDNYYALTVAAQPDGNWGLTAPSLALENGADPYVGDCKMGS